MDNLTHIKTSELNEFLINLGKLLREVEIFRERNSSLEEKLASTEKENRSLTRAYNDAEDALSKIAVMIQPLQFKPRHDLIGNYGLVATVAQLISAHKEREEMEERRLQRAFTMSNPCKDIKI